MMDQIGTYSIRTATAGVTVTAATALTLIQYSASANNTAEILFIGVSQSASTVSAQDQVRIVRKTAGATVTIGAVGTNIFDFTRNSTGGNPFLGTLSTSTTGVAATVEGTDGDEIHRANFNVLAGYERDFQPNCRIWVPVSGIVAIKMGAVTTQTWHAELIIRELRAT